MARAHPEYINDRLYGTVELPPEIWRLLRTAEMQRLQDISLSAVPSHTIPVSTPATRYEHSIGMAHLAEITTCWLDFRRFRLELMAAGLAHDCASPPFSHLSEPVMQRVVGKNHEAYAAEVLLHSQFAREAESAGIDMDIVVRLIQGSLPPISGFINGSLDLDNLDNVLRYSVSTGVVYYDRLSKLPESIAESFRLYGDTLCLDVNAGRQVQWWANCRKEMYDFIYSPRNLAPGSMLLRALEFACRAGKITPEFFRLTEREAWRLLAKSCVEASFLLADAEAWRPYQPVFMYKTTTPSPQCIQVGNDSLNRQILADAIATLLHLAPHNVTVHLGKTRGYKAITLPLLDGKTLRPMPETGLEPVWLAYVFLRPSDCHQSVRGIVEEYMRSALGI